MSDSTTTSTGGIGFPAALALLFIGLKLGHVIDWPWIWVIAPLWIGLAFVLLVMLVATVAFGVVKVVGRKR